LAKIFWLGDVPSKFEGIFMMKGGRMVGNGKIMAGNDWTMVGNVKVIMRGNMGKVEKRVVGIAKVVTT
jgi:hypothetical protein